MIKPKQFLVQIVFKQAWITKIEKLHNLESLSKNNFLNWSPNNN